jgi:hypothetical protein
MWGEKVNFQKFIQRLQSSYKKQTYKQICKNRMFVLKTAFFEDMPSKSEQLKFASAGLRSYSDFFSRK